MIPIEAYDHALDYVFSKETQGIVYKNLFIYS
jgi:hypothetical protein